MKNNEKEHPRVEFGKFVRDRRLELNIGLREFATLIDLSPAFISKMERSEKQATRIHVEKLAKALEVQEDELLTIWLSDKLLITLEEEPSAQDALKLTEKRLKTKVF